VNILKHLCNKRRFGQIDLTRSRVRLYRIAYAWSHSRSIADDLTQEAMEKALKKIDQLKEHAALDSWLYKILANCWWDYCRQQRDMDDIQDYDLSEEDHPESQYARRRVNDLVQQAITDLPDDQRQVVTLIDIGGASYIEVSEILEIPMGTVMSRLSRARKKLAVLLLPQRSQLDVYDVKATNVYPIREKQ